MALNEKQVQELTFKQLQEIVEYQKENDIDRHLSQYERIFIDDLKNTPASFLTPARCKVIYAIHNKLVDRGIL